MAPEVLHGSFYNQKVDVFSFGVVLWEVLKYMPTSAAIPEQGAHALYPICSLQDLLCDICSNSVKPPVHTQLVGRAGALPIPFPAAAAWQGKE